MGQRLYVGALRNKLISSCNFPDFLPQRIKTAEDSFVVKSFTKKASELTLQDDQGLSPGGPIATIMGVLTVAAGIILILAAYQTILPNNLISQMGMYGEILGYGVLGLGVIATMIGSVVSYRATKDKTIPLKEVSLDDSKVSHADYIPIVNRKQDNQLDVYLGILQLNLGETLVVDFPDQMEIRIYTRLNIDQGKTTSVFYGVISQEDNYKSNWITQQVHKNVNPSELPNIQYVDFGTLLQRIKDSEKEQTT